MSHGSVVLFEPESGGHQAEYITHVLAVARRRWAEPRLRLLIGAKLLEELEVQPEWTRLQETVVSVSLVEERRLAQATSGPLRRQAAVRWRILREAAHAAPAEAWVAMSLDVLQLPLALGRRLPGRQRLSGILFRPSLHWPRQRRVRDGIKNVLYRRMLLNEGLDVVLTLDPYFTGYAHRRLRGGERVQTLVDPAPVLAADGRVPAEVPPRDGRTTFLLFGALAERKGVIELLDAILLLPRSVQGRVRVILAGRVKNAMRGTVDEMLARIRAERPDVEVVVVDRYLERPEIQGLVEASDAVLAPYQNFVGSSGVLIWAALLRRAVLTQREGLLGKLTSDYGLGVTVDTRSPAAIATALTAWVEQGVPRPPEAGVRAFLAGRSPEEFGRTLLDAVCAGRR